MINLLNLQSLPAERDEIDALGGSSFSWSNC
ncbi:hypothetical protein BFL35_14025 [Clavibacter michiganensis]|nr:hypothetical protein BFL35_14025 [Clavibacter michiganensis]